MKSKIIFLRGIQGLSLVAILMVLGLGFIMPISIAQGLIVNPLLFMFLVGSFSLAGAKINNVERLAQIHQLPLTKHKVQLPCCKAA